MDGNKVLVGRAASNDDRKGKWTFPGGGINRNETPEKAAERECSEETGVACKTIQSAMPHRSKPGVAFVICRKVGGTPKPNHEFSELTWAPTSQLADLPDFYPPNLAILKDIGLL